MKYVGKKVEDIKIAYIGGGSRGWAWGLMSDLAKADDISGTVALYDIDKDAAKNNAIIGNRIGDVEGCKSVWKYEATDTIGEALTGADFVIISILPATFKEMESDVHVPEKYGIYQAVGDTVGPGGYVRALRTVPMFEEIALAVKEFCPDAWVINYTNPMTICVKALYTAFPEIKAFGCCHEVFGTQLLMAKMLEENLGLEKVNREDIKVNVVGVNHFTWLTSAYYQGMDLFPMYKEFADKYYYEGVTTDFGGHLNDCFSCWQRVKFDLFKRYGYIAAAGDRHLAEFCPGDWYLQSPEQVEDWKFGLTPVSWRWNDLSERLAKSERLVKGEEEFELKPTGEEGVEQIRAILGLRTLVTNVNMPNVGQAPNLPLGAVVETNASFTCGTVTPVNAGPIPMEIYPLISKICGNQEIVVKACFDRDLELAFSAFANDQLVRLPLDKARELFKEMVLNTKEYLTMYDLEGLK